MMQPKVTRQYVGKMDLIAHEFIENIRNLAQTDPKREMPDDFGSELNKWALESMGVIAIDRRLGCLSPTPNPEAKRIIKSVKMMFDSVYKLDFGPPLWRYFSTPTYKTLVNETNFFSALFLKSIDEAYEQIKHSPEDKPEEEQSVLERLLKIDKNVAFIMAMDMLTAGIDTVSKCRTSVLKINFGHVFSDEQKFRGRSLLPSKKS